LKVSHFILYDVPSNDITPLSATRTVAMPAKRHPRFPETCARLDSSDFEDWDPDMLDDDEPQPEPGDFSLEADDDEP
jgi:hypothetical protein